MSDGVMYLVLCIHRLLRMCTFQEENGSLLRYFNNSSWIQEADILPEPSCPDPSAHIGQALGSPRTYTAPSDSAC